MQQPQTVLDTDSLETRFIRALGSRPWIDLQDDFRHCSRIFLFGNGGNLAIAQHAASDMNRLTQKLASAPGSAPEASALVQEAGFQNWLADWLRISLRGRTRSDLADTMAIGFSASGESPNVIAALNFATRSGLRVALIAGAEPVGSYPFAVVSLGTRYYHSSEILTMLLCYQLISASGGEPPLLPRPTPQLQTGWAADVEREERTIAIDFDGVIHSMSCGFGDGRVTGDPVPGTASALAALSRDWRLVVYTSKARSDRPLVDGRTGPALLWEWLRQHKLDQFISAVASEKPMARHYIDDRAIRFTDWQHTLAVIQQQAASRQG